MNYPIWQLDFAGGGLLIATIAILHVYVAHFAVGGGLFLVLGVTLAAILDTLVFPRILGFWKPKA